MYSNFQYQLFCISIILVFNVNGELNPCYSQFDPTSAYIRMTDVNHTTSFKRSMAIHLLEHCQLGFLNWSPTVKDCQSHCSMRNNCLAISVLENGHNCALCMKLKNSTENVTDVDFNLVHIRKNKLEGE